MHPLTNLYDLTKPPPQAQPMLGYDGPVDERHLHPFALDWLGHVLAGRIGNNPPTPPDVAARRARNEAILMGLTCR